MATTEYLVLSSDGTVWTEYGTYPAANDKVAIRAAIHAGLAADKTAYVAVPTRSWTPKTPTVDTNPTVRF